ncbi:hypothetical protein J6590_086351 [Homalodisca vitripennis]|nr:hypothetical protein J6590_086351 [Homalodisca vitripennis]
MQIPNKHHPRAGAAKTRTRRHQRSGLMAKHIKVVLPSVLHTLTTRSQEHHRFLFLPFLRYRRYELISHIHGLIMNLGVREWGQIRAVPTNTEHTADQSRAVPTNGEHTADQSQQFRKTPNKRLIRAEQYRQTPNKRLIRAEQYRQTRTFG